LFGTVLNIVLVPFYLIIAVLLLVVGGTARVISEISVLLEKMCVGVSSAIRVFVEEVSKL
jgi:hypothetical protein